MSGPLPMHPRETFPHVLAQNEQDPEDQQVKFLCRTLTGLERNEIGDELVAAQVAADSVRLAAVIRKTARRCAVVALEGWENWKDDKGKPVPFPAQRTLLVEMLHPDDLVEIGSRIAIKSGLWSTDEGDEPSETEEAISD